MASLCSPGYLHSAIPLTLSLSSSPRCSHLSPTPLPRRTCSRAQHPAAALPIPCLPCIPSARRRPCSNRSSWSSLRVAAVAEGEAAAPASEGTAEEEEVYVSNDALLLYLKAEGSLSEAAIPRVIKALEACEGVENVRVTVLEGCATAECTKSISVQAASAASTLVEALQAAGFTLQTISLGFNDDGSESAGEVFKVYTEEAGDMLLDTPSLPAAE